MRIRVQWCWCCSNYIFDWCVHFSGFLVLCFCFHSVQVLQINTLQKWLQTKDPIERRITHCIWSVTSIRLYSTASLFISLQCVFHYCFVAFYYRIHNSQPLGYFKSNQFQLGSILFNLRWFYVVVFFFLYFGLVFFILSVHPFNG